MEVTIRFSDGTEITAEQNGTTYIVDEEPTFPEDLSEVEIEGEEGTTTIENAEIIECAKVPGDERYWFTVIPQTRNLEEEVDQTRADLDFIAAVTGVEL